MLSLPGLAALKLLSWYDRNRDTPRDAVDLGTLINWSEVELFDPLHDEQVDLLITNEMDPDRAAAHQLGSEICALMGPAAAEAMRFILQDERLRARLAHDMNRSRLGADELLLGLREGLTDPAGAGRFDGWP